MAGAGVGVRHRRAAKKSGRSWIVRRATCVPGRGSRQDSDRRRRRAFTRRAAHHASRASGL
ncbi:hypothetical protein DIE19_27605 [Burkholderia sp. Bp9126]|nr:hypothetical protein DIE19_27605 [Burkholderia sp. Bp9126]